MASLLIPNSDLNTDFFIRASYLFLTMKFQGMSSNPIFTLSSTVEILDIGTDRSEQTVQTQIRLLLKKQSDHGPHYLSIRQIY